MNSNNLKERTLGDGVDNSVLKLTEDILKMHIPKLKINFSNNPITFKPIEPKCKVFDLKPVYVSKERKQPKYLTRKPKEPKFVPYEPYKAAVEPIHKAVKPAVKALPLNNSKNNVEIQQLVTQMTDMRTAELNKAKAEAVQNDELLISQKQWEQEKIGFETDIKNLRETNAHLENQIKFQSQVNSELKTLLVAAVGEDLESRVQHLTEDKLQLARALLKSANHLTSHQEQTEWLSGQCEVWRSKFLATSLMVEELARWKSALTIRINDVQEVVRKLLDEGNRVQKKSLRAYCFLNGVMNKLSTDEDRSCLNLNSANLIDLSSVNSNVSEKISEIVKVNTEAFDDIYGKCTKLNSHTMVEKIAMKMLENPVTISNKQDAICNALMGTAQSLSGEQVYLKNPGHTTCCAHCKGEIENV